MAANNNPVLEHLHRLIGQDLEQTNEIIKEHLGNTQVDLITTLGAHLIESGGKRLRPILTLLSAKLFGYRGHHHTVLAAMIEYIHTATLLHDDVVDMSMTRRGKLTANVVWGEKAPVLVGDFLFSRVFQILVDHGSLHVLRIIADACAVISEGEVLQLISSKSLDTTEEQYLQVVNNKTATLFAAATRLGAVVSDRSREEEEAMATYGLWLGNAYQVVDDALDYSAQRATLGKEIGDDFNEGKITLPVIHAFRNGDPEEQAFWRGSLERGEKGEAALARAIELVRKRGSLDYCLERAHHFVRLAKEPLLLLPPGPERDALEMIADFAVARSY